MHHSLCIDQHTRQQSEDAQKARDKAVACIKCAMIPLYPDYALCRTMSVPRTKTARMGTRSILLHHSHCIDQHHTDQQSEDAQTAREKSDACIECALIPLYPNCALCRTMSLWLNPSNAFAHPHKQKHTVDHAKSAKSGRTTGASKQNQMCNSATVTHTRNLMPFSVHTLQHSRVTC